MKFEILQSDIFAKWLSKQQSIDQQRIMARLQQIEVHGNFGDHKRVDRGLFELRWAVGLRVYYIKEGSKVVILLHGGKKGGQQRDIEKAKKIKKRILGK